ncbi:response regulator [Paenibacillus sp. GCM10027626]|uniref:response regulator transcription factor n=1 Tax=Paenibacillus sp. GCM10027626 TaxID=3273411 RepID=UPI00362626F6
MYNYIIVDDEALIRRGTLKKIRAAKLDGRLNFAGEANNGENALALINAVSPDIIITDMRMPEMDGKLLLQTLQQDFPDKKVIVVSGYSDFEYMKEAISAKVVSYLLKPFSRAEIRDALVKAITLLDSERSVQKQLEHREIERQEISYDADLQLLSHLIIGLHRKEKEPGFRSSKLLALAQAKRYVLLTVYSLNGSDPSNLDSFIEEPNAACVYVPHTQHDHLSFYLFYDGHGDQGLRASAITAAAQIAAKASGNLKLGISSEKGALSELFRSYEETMEALNSIRIDENGTVVASHGDDSEYSASAVRTWDRTDELLFFIESGNVAKTAELTEMMFAYYSEISDMRLAEVKNECRLLVQEVRTILNRNFQIDGNQSPSSSFEAVLSGFYDLEAIKAHLQTILPSIAEMMLEQHVYSSEHIIDNIKAYIRNNFNKTLTLEKISSLFFLNPSYCSFLFKEKTGINYIDYVNQVRIDNAKAMLENSDDKVYKIAKALGYDNTKYFFRVFKKLTGLTPEEYRTQKNRSS